MIKILKVGKNCWLTDKITKENIPKYDHENKNLVLTTTLENDNSVLTVTNDQIYQQYGGSIYFDYQDDRYLIDDDYQDLLIRAGYIVQDQYDKEQELDKDKGFATRDELMNKIASACHFINIDNHDMSILPDNGNRKIMIYYKSGFKFTIIFDTVNSIVTKNQERKLNQLPFYPFSKKMDKFGTMYMSIFCQKLEENEENKNSPNLRYTIAEDFISYFISVISDMYKSNTFHYSPLIVKKRIVNQEVITE